MLRNEAFNYVFVGLGFLQCALGCDVFPWLLGFSMTGEIVEAILTLLQYITMLVFILLLVTVGFLYVDKYFNTPNNKGKWND